MMARTIRRSRKVAAIPNTKTRSSSRTSEQTEVEFMEIKGGIYNLLNEICSTGYGY